MATEPQTLFPEILNTSDEKPATRDERRETINMQNKPNLPAPQMNVNKVLTKDYENVRLAYAPKTNPIKLEAKRRSLRVSFLESSNRGPISPPSHLRLLQLFAVGCPTEKIS